MSNWYESLPYESLVYSKEEGKDQESIQPSTTSDQETIIWESDKSTRKLHTQESQEVSPFPAGHHKAERTPLTDKTI